MDSPKPSIKEVVTWPSSAQIDRMEFSIPFVLHSWRNHFRYRLQLHGNFQKPGSKTAQKADSWPKPPHGRPKHVSAPVLTRFLSQRQTTVLWHVPGIFGNQKRCVLPLKHWVWKNKSKERERERERERDRERERERAASGCFTVLASHLNGFHVLAHLRWRKSQDMDLSEDLAAVTVKEWSTWRWRNKNDWEWD